LIVLSGAAQADIRWTGAVDKDIFREANWDLSASTVTAVNPNQTINDNIVITGGSVEIPDLPGQVRFQVGDGFTLTLDQSTLTALGDDGVGGISGTSAGPWVILAGGAEFDPQFITNGVRLLFGPLCSADFGGGANPINLSKMKLTPSAVLAFKNETVADYIAEHLFKTSVDSAPAQVGVNVQVLSDGGTGCVVSVITPYPNSCQGTIVACPCGNGNDGSNGPAGCANSAHSGGVSLSAGGSSSVSNADLMLYASGLVPGRMGVFFQGDLALGGGAGLPFGDGLRCVGSGVVRLSAVMANAGGLSATTVNIPVGGSIQPGNLKRYQLWYSDGPGAPCGSGFNLSNAIEVTWGP
jgi:hypothetical protein